MGSKGASFNPYVVCGVRVGSECITGVGMQPQKEEEEEYTSAYNMVSEGPKAVILHGADSSHNCVFSITM